MVLEPLFISILEYSDARLESILLNCVNTLILCYITLLTVLQKEMFTQSPSSMEPRGSFRMLTGCLWLQGTETQLTSSTWFCGQVPWDLEQGLQSWLETRQPREVAPPLPSQLLRIMWSLVCPPHFCPLLLLLVTGFLNLCFILYLGVAASAQSGLLATSLSVESFQLLLL